MRVLFTIFLALSLGLPAYAQVLREESLTKTDKLKKLNIDSVDMSGEKYIYIDAESRNWIVKNNPLNLIINEFVASKVYQFIIGSSVPEAHLFVGSSGISLAFKPTLNFFPYGIEGLARDGTKFKNIFAKAKRAKKTVTGLEESIYATLLVFDPDIEFGSNFAKIETRDSIQITRFDFDDSFKFYDSFKITEPYLGEEYTAIYKLRGIYDLVIEMLRANSKYEKPSYACIDFKLPEISYSMEKMDEINTFIHVRQKEMFAEIEKAYLEIEAEVSEESIRSAYDFNQLLKTARQYNIKLNEKTSAARQLSTFTIEVLKRRLANMNALFNLQAI